MIEISEIEDGDSLRQWLTEWFAQNGLDEVAARAVAVSIAHRAAMRVLPLWWDFTLSSHPNKRELAPLPMLRLSLVSEAAINISTSGLKTAFAFADASSDAHIFAAGFVDVSARVATRAALDRAAAPDAIADVVHTVNTKAADLAASTAVYVADADLARSGIYATNWISLQADCKRISDGGGVLTAPLWSNSKNPFDEVWRDIKTRETAPEWSFWIKWYEDALAGKPPNWKMLEAIALIEPKFWEAGPEAVADEIAKITERFNLLDTVRSLKEERAQPIHDMASVAQRSHNQPPEIIDMPAEVIGAITLVWENLDHAETELEKPDPNKGRLEAFGRAILQGITNVARYCAKVADTAIMAGAKVVGTAGAGLLLDHFFNSGRVLEFANRLLRYATGG